MKYSGGCEGARLYQNFCEQQRAKKFELNSLF